MPNPIFPLFPDALEMGLLRVFFSLDCLLDPYPQPFPHALASLPVEKGGF